MTDTPLHRFLSAKASEFNIPGSAIAVFADGEESYAFHGTTSVEDARPLDGDTLFHFGSITKTYTATAIMRLVAEGKIDLDAPVRRYLPGFRLSDEDAAAAVTITHLLNHTAGWSDYLPEGGDGSLGSYVAGMAGVPVETPPGRHAAYKNAGFAIAGLIMESLTGTAYEEAMRSLVLDPVGLTTATFMTRKPTGHVAMGHAAQADGTLDITTDWVAERYADPSGGIVSTIGDQLRWARFHLSDGADVLPRALLVQMQQPTTEVEGDYFGDGIGLGWFLRTTGGVRTVGHGGSMVGQYSWLLLVPERNFAVVTVATAGPNGIPYNQDVVRWALETYLGVVDRDPEPLPFDEARARELVGTYETATGRAIVRADGEQLLLDFEVTAEALEVIGKAPDFEPSEFGMLSDANDQYIVTSGPLAGMRGVFSRDASGAIETINLAGRSYLRVP
ncbi:beta-lactamase family protein (plasmid) [Streptomyces sp. NBC_01136]|uniref:serine hydrolase domain-containing protein n=1 Tax=unclassified Streptomyces TaxID=2593676 RepID=UPI002F90D03B|nr:beta-lactamase family protein [Streptomyces sp. NBC_01136]